jgi:glyoxylase-like metal-dependent hydrolase (beta-lactamase superfamily II)
VSLLRVGEWSIDRVVDIESLPYRAADVFADVPGDDLAAVGRRLPLGRYRSEGRLVLLDFAAYLLRRKGMTVLVDSAVGGAKDRPDDPGWHLRTDHRFIDRLAALGCSAEDVDVVVSTHLHADHVGWNTTLTDGEWRPTFPHARYLLPRAETQPLLDDPGPGHCGSFADSVAPLFAAGVADLVDEGHQVGVGLALEVRPGHSAGTTVVRIQGERGDALVVGDVIHHEVQLARPEWTTRFCADAPAAAAVRTAVLAELADRGGVLLPAHFPPCRVHRDGEGFAGTRI